MACAHLVHPDPQCEKQKDTGFSCVSVELNDAEFVILFLNAKYYTFLDGL